MHAASFLNKAVAHLFLTSPTRKQQHQQPVGQDHHLDLQSVAADPLLPWPFEWFTLPGPMSGVMQRSDPEAKQ